MDFIGGAIYFLVLLACFISMYLTGLEWVESRGFGCIGVLAYLIVGIPVAIHAFIFAFQIGPVATIAIAVVLALVKGLWSLGAGHRQYVADPHDRDGDNRFADGQSFVVDPHSGRR